ncbi:MAG: WYL domain-containing protein, partial [Firmicutes bacterium HGW-Firmicutes-13]
YDGSTTKREVDPYGLICRFNNWYLIGFCREKQNRRVFLLDHIQRLKVKENSVISLPADFSLRDI